MRVQLQHQGSPEADGLVRHAVVVPGVGHHMHAALFPGKPWFVLTPALALASSASTCLAYMGHSRP